MIFKNFSFLSLSFVLAFIHTPAYAYLDPGSVSLALQAAIAAIAGAALFWRYWFWRLLDLFGIKKTNPSDSADPEPGQAKSDND